MVHSIILDFKTEYPEDSINNVFKMSVTNTNVVDMISMFLTTGVQSDWMKLKT